MQYHDLPLFKQHYVKNKYGKLPQRLCHSQSVICCICLLFKRCNLCPMILKICLGCWRQSPIHETGLPFGRVALAESIFWRCFVLTRKFAHSCTKSQGWSSAVNFCGTHLCPKKKINQHGFCWCPSWKKPTFQDKTGHHQIIPTYGPSHIVFTQNAS